LIKNNDWIKKKELTKADPKIITQRKPANVLDAKTGLKHFKK